MPLGRNPDRTNSLIAQQPEEVADLPIDLRFLRDRTAELLAQGTTKLPAHFHGRLLKAPVGDFQERWIDSDEDRIIWVE